MTTNLNIESIFPNYTFTSTAATKAVIDDAFVFSGNPADGETLTVTFDAVTYSINFLGSLSSGAGANVVEIKIGANAATNRDLLKKAINGSSDNTNIAYGSGVEETEGINGVSAVNGTTTNGAKIQSEDAGAFQVDIGGTASNVVVSSTTTGTGTAVGGTMQFDIADLDLSQNPLTASEAAATSGDYRKVLFHFIEKYEQYLSSYEQVTGITVTAGGTGFIAGDVVNFSGGNPDTAATATVGSVDSSGVIQTITISSNGKGYTSAPTLTVTSTSGANATLTAVISDRVPTNLTMSRGSLSEDTDAGTFFRTYGSTFGFESTSIDIKAE